MSWKISDFLSLTVPKIKLLRYLQRTENVTIVIVSNTLFLTPLRVKESVHLIKLEMVFEVGHWESQNLAINCHTPAILEEDKKRCIEDSTSKWNTRQRMVGKSIPLSDKLRRVGVQFKGNLQKSTFNLIWT